MSNNQMHNKSSADNSQGTLSVAAGNGGRSQTPPAIAALPMQPGKNQKMNIPPPPFLGTPPVAMNGSHSGEAVPSATNANTSIGNGTSHYKSGIVREGWVLKRASRFSTQKVWNVRYFILRSDDRTLSYYVRRSDIKPKNSIPIVASDCEVSDIYVDQRRRATPEGHAEDDSWGGGGIDAEQAEADEAANDPQTSSSKKKTRETLYCVKISWGSAKVLGKGDSSSNMASSPERGPAGNLDAEGAKSSVDGTATTGSKKMESHAVPASPGPTALNTLDQVGESGGEQVFVNAPTSNRNRGSSTTSRNHPAASAAGSASQLEEAMASDATPTTASMMASTGGNGTLQAPRSPRRKAASTSTSPFSYPESDFQSEMSTPSSSAQPLYPPSPAAGGASSSATRTPRRTRRVSAPTSAAGTATARSSSVPPALPTIEDFDKGSRRSPKKHARDPMSVSQHNRSEKATNAPTHKRSSSGAAALAKEALANMRDSSRSVTGAGSSKTTSSLASNSKTDNGASTKQKGSSSHSMNNSSSDLEADILALRRTDSVEEEEHLHNAYRAAKRANQKRTKRRIRQGSIAVATGAVVVATGVLTMGFGLVVSGVAIAGAAAAAGGSGAVAEASYNRSRREGGVLVIALSSLEEAKAWKAAIEAVMNSDQVTSNTWAALYEQEGRSITSVLMPTPSDARMSRNSRGSGGGAGTSPGDGWVVTKSTATTTSCGYGAATRDLAKSSELQIDPMARWRPLDGGWATLLGIGAHGLRIFREEEKDKDKALVQHTTRRGSLSVEGRPCALLRAELILTSSPLTAFMCLMSNGRMQNEGDNSFLPNSGQRASFRVIETLDEHMDVIHVIFRPLYLFPSWTTPRDFVLFRYWRLHTNGAYVICYDSVEHRECPPMPGYVRGELHGVYTIAPRKHMPSGGGGSSSASSTWAAASECLLTHWVQVHPRGWVPTFPLPPLANQGYAEAFSVAALLQMLDVKDALDHDRFVSVTMGRPGPQESSPLAPSASAGSKLRKAVEESKREIVDDDDEEPDYDYIYPNAADTTRHHQQQQLSGTTTTREAGPSLSSWADARGTGLPTMATVIPPLPLEMWDQVDADTFRVRGKSYKTDKVKVNAGQAALRLIAVDILESDASILGGVCLHPEERVQRALARERRDPGGNHMPAFVLAVNIVLPGPPFYHMMFYFGTDDLSTIDGSDGTEFSRLAKEFLFGNDDAFRDATFKLIPRIVQGNFVVRKAVGSTPAIMGTKLKQTYARSLRFLEVILDCGSSAVAAGVIRLCLGYAKTIAVDMAFVLEGKEEEHLPERVLGSVRLSHVEFGKKQVRYVPSVVT